MLNRVGVSLPRSQVQKPKDLLGSGVSSSFSSSKAIPNRKKENSYANDYDDDDDVCECALYVLLALTR